MAYPTDVVATGDLITAAQINRWGVLLADSTLSSPAATFDFTSIPAHWTHLELVVYSRGDVAATGADLWLRFNGDTAGNYDWQYVAGGAAVAVAAEGLAATKIIVGGMPGSTGPANAFSMTRVDIGHYAGASNQKSLVSQNAMKSSEASGGLAVNAYAGFWRSNAAINQITVLPSSGNFDTGSRASLYGMGRI